MDPANPLCRVSEVSGASGKYGPDSFCRASWHVPQDHKMASCALQLPYVCSMQPCWGYLSGRWPSCRSCSCLAKTAAGACRQSSWLRTCGPGLVSRWGDFNCESCGPHHIPPFWAQRMSLPGALCLRKKKSSDSLVKQ